MAYIGNTPAEAYTSFDKQTITGNGGASYTLDHAVANEQEIEVFVNNVRQEPSVAYTVSGTALTMTGNVESSDDFYVVFQGKAIQTTSHPEGHDLKAREGTFSGDLTVDTNTLHVDATNNRVGVNTTSPTHPFHVNSASMKVGSGDNTADARIIFESDSNMGDGWVGIPTWADDHLYLFGPNGAGGNEAVMDYDGTNEQTRFYTGGSERMRVTANGLTFNGDTAATNALDDYEEGTWTPNFGMHSGSASFTYQSNGRQGYYTKIGNQVTVWFIIHSAGTTVTTDGPVKITGLPFTSANNHARSYSLGFKQLLDVNEVGLLLAINPNTSVIELFEGHASYPESDRHMIASYFGADRRIRGTMTYMV